MLGTFAHTCTRTFEGDLICLWSCAEWSGTITPTLIYFSLFPRSRVCFRLRVQCPCHFWVTTNANDIQSNWHATRYDFHLRTNLFILVYFNSSICSEAIWIRWNRIQLTRRIKSVFHLLQLFLMDLGCIILNAKRNYFGNNEMKKSAANAHFIIPCNFYVDRRPKHKEMSMASITMETVKVALPACSQIQPTLWNVP